MNRVLLFGGTGAVGRGCLEVLIRSAETSLVLAGRDETRLREVASAIDAAAEIVRVDIDDHAAVCAAATRCDVVINCAGPSQRFSARVAAAAIDAGVPYVDPGGDQSLLEHLAALAPAVPVVLQTGVQPGLSGLLLKLLASHRAEDIDSLTAWCGGLQPLTPASVLEYRGSLRDSNGHPGATLQSGLIRRAGRDECTPAPAQHFSHSATVHPHLDAETVAVAGHLGVGNICWLNVFDGVHTTRAMQLLAVQGEPVLDLSSVQQAATLDLFGREPYFTLVASAHGGSGTTELTFSCPDSYRVTGALTAFAAGLVPDMPAGVHPFWSIDDPQRAVEFVTEAVAGARFSIMGDLASLMIEEGSL